MVTARRTARERAGATSVAGLGLVLVLVVLVAALACGRVQDSVGRVGTEPGGDAGLPRDAAPPQTADACTGPASDGSSCDARAPSLCRRIPLTFRPVPGGPCEWTIPAVSGGLPVDPSLVQDVTYEDDRGPRYLLPLSGPLSSAADCRDLLGWYLDDAGHPTAVLGCPAICALATSGWDGGSLGGFTALVDCQLALPNP